MRRSILYLAAPVIVIALLVLAPRPFGQAAAPSGPALPADKQSLVDAEASFQAANPDRQATAEELAAATVIPQRGEPPVTGLVTIDAPMAASEFSPNGQAYSTIQDGTWIRVWAGAPIDSKTNGLVLVMSVPMTGDLPDPDANTSVELLAPPISGGPLQIVGLDEAGRVIVANPAGKRIPFNAVTHAFGG